MFKTEPETPNTDNGWVYGTVTPDGNRVTSAGRVTPAWIATSIASPIGFSVRENRGYR